eukprot:scaffold5901_cov116-Cylindrotheca_fusiformis.AAC.7
MGRNRRRGPGDCGKTDERWKNATERTAKDGRKIQVVGLESITGTLFGRLSAESDSMSSIALGEFVDVMMGNLSLDSSGIGGYQADQLCQLGAVWVLPSRSHTNHPQNAPKWMREYNCQYAVEGESTVRVHSRPARFPAFNNVEVIHENKEIGYVVLNKPGGCPSHATVDNGVENALAELQRGRKCAYATLPQRLDTETYGILLVATDKRFSSYISRIMEEKTKDCIDCEGKTIDPTNCLAMRKKYRCLVVLAGRDGIGRYKKLQDLRGQIVTHFLDVQSPAPKRFLMTIPPEEAKLKKWQRCHLRLANVSRMYSLVLTDSSRSAGTTLAAALWGNHLPPNRATHVAQVEVELLTGRTHQIRGQLSAMGVPIVGDPLYGGASESFAPLSDRESIRMGLQCCAIEFPQPIRNDAGPKKWLYQATDSTCLFQLEKSWWTEYLERE